mgnify:CR=1 FL=1
MADTVTSQTIVNGPSKLIMKFTNTSDGTGESAVKKVDVSLDKGKVMIAYSMNKEVDLDEIKNIFFC